MYGRRSSSPWALVVLVAVFLSLFELVFSVKHENFKTCDQSGFCKRNRRFADTASTSAWNSPYSLDPSSIKFNNGKLEGVVLKPAGNSEASIRLPIIVTFLESGSARVTIDEEKRQKGEVELRHNSKVRKERYNEAAKFALVGDLTASAGAALDSSADKGTTVVKYGPSGKFQAVINHSPFTIDFKKDGETHIQFNDRGFMNVEHWRPKTENNNAAPKEGEDAVADVPSKPDSYDEEETWWEESFGGNTDTKPRGPESLGLDISFPGYSHVYGIPEHATPLSLKETRGGEGAYSEPYRLYNSDVFEYELDSPMTLYGAIPFMQAHRKGSTVGVFWLNAAETWVDVVKANSKINPLALGVKSKTSTQTHWFSESGLIDVFVFLGTSPKDIVHAYTELTGYTQLPQSFAVAYHQSRWNYVTDQDVVDVSKKFDRNAIPFDVLWLDIEYTQEKKYFTFDPDNFPRPEIMNKELVKADRKLVVIIDPHIKNTDNYPVVAELKSKGLAVQTNDGGIFEGWCWPGASHYIDAFNPSAVEWWKSLFKYDRFKGTFPNTFIWNDMNEPSVFNGPETTMPKDNIHHDNWEHRDLHNLNGMTYHNATYQALLSRSKAEELNPRRPFVLTRAFFSGSQRTAAMWTGDNLAEWGHLAASIPMILNQGISGYPWAGADVGGFFGNPSRELLTRWYQAGAFYPFFRAHAHIDTRRREPYIAGEPYTSIMAAAVRLRYSLLPAWYTAFREASVNGEPIVKPNFYVHPDDEEGFAVDDQMYLGRTGLLVKPVVTEATESADIYLADNEVYYEYEDYNIVKGRGSHKIAAPLAKLPLLMRGGNIFPRRDRVRRSSSLMKNDPMTLVVVLGESGDATGELYHDDGDSFDYQKGAYIHRRFTFTAANNILSSENIASAGKLSTQYLSTVAPIRFEKVIIVGAPAKWSKLSTVKVVEEGEKEKKVEIRFTPKSGNRAAHAVVRNPGVAIGKGWSIDFS